MSEVVNCPKQPIPAYSGIVINITNPTLNAAPMQNYSNYPNDMNAVGVNVINPQVQQNQGIKEQKSTINNDMVSPNGYYSRAEIEKDYETKSSDSKMSNYDSVNKDTSVSNNAYSEKIQNSGSNIRNTQENSSQVNTSENTSTYSDSQKYENNNSSIKNTAAERAENTSENSQSSIANSSSDSNSSDNSSVNNNESSSSEKNTVQNTTIQKEIIETDKKDSVSDIQAKAYATEAENIATSEATPNQNGNSVYPAPYYINNYYGDSERKGENKNNNAADNNPENANNTQQIQSADNLNGIQDEDMSTSQNIIANIDEKRAEEIESEQNGKKIKVVALTNEYIMSLENYLNNPNIDIRLMASKEILTRLNEDRSRFDDAALNALLNKMLQDPAKLVRVAALSALASDLASGNDYTVELLNRIQQNPNSDKEDVLDAAQILLNMSASTETRYVPIRNVQNGQVEE